MSESREQVLKKRRNNGNNLETLTTEMDFQADLAKCNRPTISDLFLPYGIILKSLRLKFHELNSHLDNKHYALKIKFHRELNFSEVKKYFFFFTSEHI